QQVDGLANRDSTPAQRPEIACRGGSDDVAGHRHDLEAAQQSLNLLSRPLAIEALKHFAKHQVTHDDLFRAEERAEPPDMRRITAVEEVDPDAAVDNDHPAPRPLRLRARLPRQRYLPNASPTSCCPRSLTIKRSACSTVCFLFRFPE